MNTVRTTNENLAGVVPYDPKYLPAEAMLSANENPQGLPPQVAARVADALAGVAVNRYPDPLANELRDEIAQAWGLARECVLVGNGGDELLFDMAFAWGGPGRLMVDLPPTFSVYAANARLCGTAVENIPRVVCDSAQAGGASVGAGCASADGSASAGCAPAGASPEPAGAGPEPAGASLEPADASPEPVGASAFYCRIDVDALLARLAAGGVDYLHLCSPNNPTGDVASLQLVERVLNATDALVIVDEAYGEFGGVSAVPLLGAHKNLAILRTFSKAYSLAGVRVGYVLANPEVVTELLKVRQPYSVDALSQVVAREVFAARELFVPRTELLVAERARVLKALCAMDGVQAWDSQANYLLFRPVNVAGESVWQQLFDAGVLVRDFSGGALTPGCLRVSMGTPEENDRFLAALAQIVKG